ncbi:hypothetical protein [Marinicella gelatinilytica]|uniref:hypothetical protein n=1 Tax=Marinicella gelatinilytica TaxID=2996017 RepID=UPI002260FBC9|nr:hypothetical protein [Marinicella gelatinilytica]MCX7544499.1 hypothetical protein [Marinicella gelatinilytica]
MSKIIKFIGHALAIVSIIFLIQIFIENYHQLADLPLYWYSYVTVIIIILLGLTGFLIMSFAWLTQLKENYPDFGISEAFTILAVSQIAKYLPGNVGHYVGRYYLSAKYIKKADVIYSFLIENIMLVFASTLVGSFYLLYANINEWVGKQETYIALIIITLSLPVLYWANKKLKFKLVTLRTNYLILFKLLTLFVIMTILGGLSIYAIFYLITPLEMLPFWLLTSAFSFSFLLGFVIPGAPGGIGIREYVFTLLLTPFIGQIIALQAIVLFRLISIISDLILFLIGKYLSKRQETLDHA